MNMEKYTKKQRKEIYLRAAEYVHNYRFINNFFPNDWCCACFGIKAATNFELGYADVFKKFKEFQLIRPSEKKDDNLWFGATEGTEARINALLLSSEMCNP